MLIGPMANHLKMLGINHEYALDAHGQIGRVERVNRTIQEGARSAMVTSELMRNGFSMLVSM